MLWDTALGFVCSFLLALALAAHRQTEGRTPSQGLLQSFLHSYQLELQVDPLLFLGTTLSVQSGHGLFQGLQLCSWVVPNGFLQLFLLLSQCRQFGPNRLLLFLQPLFFYQVPSGILLRPVLAVLVLIGTGGMALDFDLWVRTMGLLKCDQVMEWVCLFLSQH